MKIYNVVAVLRSFVSGVTEGVGLFEMAKRYHHREIGIAIAGACAQGLRANGWL